MAKHYSATKHIYTLNDEVSQYPHRRPAAKKKLQEVSLGTTIWSLISRMFKRITNGMILAIARLSKKN
jgi:hypothetical protein